MWSGLASVLTVEGLTSQISGFLLIPVVAAVILAVLGILLVMYVGRKLTRDVLDNRVLGRDDCFEDKLETDYQNQAGAGPYVDK